MPFSSPSWIHVSVAMAPLAYLDKLGVPLDRYLERNGLPSHKWDELRGVVPPWFPLVGIEGAPVNLVPVDFVAAALDHIAH